MDLFDYPQSPGWKARDTAEAAAAAIKPTAATLRAKVVKALELYGPMTADQCAVVMKEDRLSIRPRLSELAALGQVADSKARRTNDSGRTAIVWALNQQGTVQ